MLIGITSEYNGRSLDHYPVHSVDVISTTINPLIRFKTCWQETFPPYDFIHLINHNVYHQIKCDIIVRDIVNQNLTNVWLLVNAMIVSNQLYTDHILFGVTFDHLSTNSEQELSTYSGILSDIHARSYFETQVNWAAEGF